MILRSKPPQIVLVTAGEQSRLTGGNLYNRQMLKALCDSPWFADVSIDKVAIPASFETGSIAPLSGDSAEWLQVELERLSPTVVIVDSIALVTCAPIVEWLRWQLGARVVALMHMLPSALAEATRATEAELRDFSPLPTGKGEGEGRTHSTLSDSFPARQAQDLNTLERSFLQSVDRIVAVSPSLRDELTRVGAPSDRIDVVLPGWDGYGAGRLDSEDARPPTGPDLPIRFLCVANWTAAKGIHRVIAAFGSLRVRGVNVALDLVGDEGTSSYARLVHDLAARHDVADRVTFHGVLPPSGVADRYRSADVFVLASRSEGFGTAFAEAMSHGLPVIAESVGALPWMVGLERGVLVPPGDGAALTVAMLGLASSPERRRTMGRAGREFVRGLPTWEYSGVRFADIVRVLVERGTAADQ